MLAARIPPAALALRSGRSVVAERFANGTEERRDNLINIQDGTAFDAEWRGNNSATQINVRARELTGRPAASVPAASAPAARGVRVPS